MPSMTSFGEQGGFSLVRNDAPKKTSIVSAPYDWVFFILAPVWSFILGIALALSPLKNMTFPVKGDSLPVIYLIGTLFSSAHPLIVLFRSHGNRPIYRTYPIRFIVVPFFLYAFIVHSKATLMLSFTVAGLWNIYHSSLQTFGLCRIYDSRYNEDNALGRKLDLTLNFVVAFGLIFANFPIANQYANVDDFVGVFYPPLAPLVNELFEHRAPWMAVFLTGIALYFIYYVLAYRKLMQNGYILPRKKVALLVSTYLCAFWVWIFNPFNQAVFIMTFAHALQYFALVTYTEREHVTRQLGLSDFPWGGAAAVILMIAAAGAFAVWGQWSGQFNHFTLGLIILISILHYWYDSFIWSVQKKQI